MFRYRFSQELDLPYALLRPYSFHQVTNGRVLTSSFPLFSKLPPELYSYIIDELDFSDLKSLALVDSDCCCLARSYLFAHINLDYHDSYADFHRRLLEESSAHPAQERPRLPLAACVKHVKFDMSASYRPIQDERGLANPFLSPQDRDSLSLEADEVERQLVMSAASVIEHALFNCFSISWRNTSSPLTLKVLQSLMISSASHLNLCVQVDADTSMDPSEISSLAHRGRWELETLSVQFYKPVDQAVDVATRFLQNILTLAANSLHELIWIDYSGYQRTLRGVLPPFPQLRKLTIDAPIVVDTDMIVPLFLSGNLNDLHLNFGDSVAMSHFLSSLGHIPSLESFQWTNPSFLKNETDHMQSNYASFLTNNRQLVTYEARHALPEKFIQRLFPSLASSFSNLTRAQIIFDALDISLGVLRSLPVSLKSLSVSAGPQFPYQPAWKPNHAHIAIAISHLFRLRYLEFFADLLDEDGQPNWLEEGIYRDLIESSEANQHTFPQIIWKSNPIAQTLDIPGDHERHALSKVLGCYVDVLGALECCMLANFEFQKDVTRDSATRFDVFALSNSFGVEDVTYHGRVLEGIPHDSEQQINAIWNGHLKHKGAPKRDSSFMRRCISTLWD